MNPMRNTIANQMVPVVIAEWKACKSPVRDKVTGPTCIIPRLSKESPVVAHTTMAKTITSVFTRSFRSLDIS
jgi:hypothetical protein